MSPFDYLRLFYPHFQHDTTVSKYVVPIRPGYHQILFPDYEIGQLSLFRPTNTAGNAIKLAYLCYAQINAIHPGDIVLFYRSEDHKAITSIGVVEQYVASNDAAEIASLVSRRTVYSMDEIAARAVKPTKVMLFRLVKHFENPIPHQWLQANAGVKGNIQSIRSIGHEEFEAIVTAGG